MSYRSGFQALKWIAPAALLLLLGSGCSNRSMTGKIIAVEIPGRNIENLEGARIIEVDPEASRNKAVVLSKGFSSAASPSLSHDGRFLFFQGKKQDSDPWQIWMMDLQKNKFHQVTDLPEPCTHPVPIPDETVVFSRQRTVKEVVVNDLWRCGNDGCCLTQITHNPSMNVEAAILNEGRILYLSSQQYPDPRSPVLMVMRPDGTKSELYSPGCCGWSPVTGGAESADGYIYFISSGGRLSRVLHRRPLHTFENLSDGIEGTFSAVTPLPEGGCLVSYRPAPGEPTGLYTFNEGNGRPELVFQGDRDITDPVWIMAMDERPRILPSAVNPENPTGLLMSQDINHSMLPVHPGIAGDTMATSIRVSYLEGKQAVTEVEMDGSFYLKMDTDSPFRIETLNKAGETVRGPSDWIYLRPNERRACTGCHADPELAPENIQPLAVKKDPVEIYARMKESSN